MSSTVRRGPIANVIPGPDADACGITGCTHNEWLVAVEPLDVPRARRTVCARHLVEYLEELRA